MNPLIACKNIGKKYGKVTALQNIDFEVNPGEIYGVIGPDGAGKTTLFRILTTLILADEGEAKVMGFDVVSDFQSIRNRIGYMPGRFSLYQDLTVEENINFFATVFNTSLEENYHLVSDIYSQLEPFKNRRAGKLSGGMKQKLALSCALIHKPDVLFLDEPTTGVDPVSRKEFWDMLKRLKEKGIAILVSTPYMDEAALCDRIALIQNGSFLKVDTPQGIIEHFTGDIWEIKAKEMARLLTDLRKNTSILKAYTFGETHHIIVKTKEFSEEKLNLFLVELGHRELKIQKIKPGIEDCFMEFSNNKDE